MNVNIENKKLDVDTIVKECRFYLAMDEEGIPCSLANSHRFEAYLINTERPASENEVLDVDEGVMFIAHGLFYHVSTDTFYNAVEAIDDIKAGKIVEIMNSLKRAPWEDLAMKHI